MSEAPLSLACAMLAVDIATVTMRDGHVSYTPLPEASTQKLLDAVQAEASTGDA